MKKKLVVEVGVCRLWRLCLFKTPAAKTRQMCLIPLASPRFLKSDVAWEAEWKASSSDRNKQRGRWEM